LGDVTGTLEKTAGDQRFKDEKRPKRDGYCDKTMLSPTGD